MEKPNLEQILDMFQNGEQRYEKGGYFREAIDAMVLGVGIYAILDRVLKEHTTLTRLHSEQLDKNRVAVAEVQRLTDEVASYKDALDLARQSRKEYPDNPGGRDNY